MKGGYIDISKVKPSKLVKSINSILILFSYKVGRPLVARELTFIYPLLLSYVFEIKTVVWSIVFRP